MRKSTLLLTFFLGVSVFAAWYVPRVVYGCGCGLALSDEEEFRALRETEAYMLIEVQDKNRYSLKPFFRLVSMDKPRDITLVFPVSDIPKKVVGKKLTVGEFLQQEGIDDAEKKFEKQDVKRALQELKKSAIRFSQGLVYLSLTSRSPQPQVGGMKDQLFNSGLVPEVPLAHFEFEGGTLDIYEAASRGKLQDVIRAVGKPLAEEVRRLAEKYRDYYVAVLSLRVPSVIPERPLQLLRQCAPNALQEVNDLLSEGRGAVVNRRARMSKAYNEAAENAEVRDCNPSEVERIFGGYLDALSPSTDALEGTLVAMQFEGSNQFFYPVSIVGSYHYPIPRQGYYILVPSQLRATLQSSYASRVALLKGRRWYKIESSNQDIQGVIAPASLGDYVRDASLVAAEAVIDHTTVAGIGAALFLFLLLLLLSWWWRRFGWKVFLGIVAAYIIGGLFLAALVFLLLLKIRKA